MQILYLLFCKVHFANMPLIIGKCIFFIVFRIFLLKSFRNSEIGFNFAIERLRERPKPANALYLFPYFHLLTF